MSTNVGTIDFRLLLNSNPFNKGLKNAEKSVKSSGIEGALGKIGKMALTAFSVKAIVDFGKECIKLGSDLSEVQNVVDVAFGNLNSEVDKFAQNAIEQFGLGQTVTKKYVGTFGAMAKAFDFNNQAALEMSKTLTGLTGDVASFYNLSTDEAYTKLKSVFTGETETLKDLGVVMTQNALDQYALANGYGKTTAKMSEQEKVALRYKFVMDKLSLAQGDFARTSDSWANQTRVLSLRFNELKATLGQGFINLFTPIVKGINLLLSKLQVLANAFKSFTEFITGRKSEGSGGLGSVATDVAGIENSADNASNAISGIGSSAKKSAKDLKSLASFDTAQVLKSNSDDSSSGVGSAGGSAGLDFGNSLSNTMGQQVQEIGAMFNNINFEPLITSFNRIKEAAEPLITNIKDGLKWLYDNVLLPLATWTIEDLLPAFLNLIAGALKVLDPLIEAFKPIFQWFWDNFLQPIATWTGGVIVSTLNGLADILTTIGDWMSNNKQTVTNMEVAILGFFGAWKTVELMSFIAQAGGVINALKGIATAIWTCTGAKIADKIETVTLTLMYAKDFVVSIASGTAALVKQAAQWVATTAMKVADTAATIASTVATGAATAATWLFNAALAVLTSPITLVVVAIGALIAAIVAIVKNWDTVSEALTKGWEWIKQKAEEIWNGIKDFFGNLWNGIKDTASNIWNGIKDFFSNTWEETKQDASVKWEKTKEILGNAWNGIKENASNTFNKVKDFLSNTWEETKQDASTKWEVSKNLIGNAWNKMKENASNIFGNIKNTIQNIWNGISSFFSNTINNIKNGFMNGFNAVKNGIVNIFNGIRDKITSIVGGFVGIIKQPINGIISIVNKAIRSLNKIKVNIPDWVPGLGGKGFGINIPTIPQLANGGYVKANTPQLAMIGDNRHQGEVVAPEDKIMELYKKANKEMGLGNNSKVIELLEKILELLRNLDFDFNLYLDSYKLEKGLEKARNKRKFATNGG